jgi:hypothetical protein
VLNDEMGLKKFLWGKMRVIFAVLIFFSVGAVHAATYLLVPTMKTEALCRKLGLAGEFEVKKYSGNSWVITFASGTEKIVKKKANGVYYSMVSCATGRMGYAEVRLNLNSKEFYYWNSIDRNPEICQGEIVLN